MSRSSTSLSFGETRLAAAPRAAVRAYLAVAGALGALTTGTMLIMAVAANSGSEAARIAATQDAGYAATLVSALAVDLPKPQR